MKKTLISVLSISLILICTLFAFTGCANDTTIPPSGSSTSSPPEDPAIQWADPVIKHIISTAYLDKTVEDEFEKQIDLGVLTYSTETFWEYVGLVDTYMTENDIHIPQSFLDNIKSFSVDTHPDHLVISISYHDEAFAESKGIDHSAPPWITISNLSDFAHMPNLEALEVYATTATDLTPISSLSTLNTFGINSAYMSKQELAHIGQLIDLRELYLKGINSHNLSFISKLYSLETLGLFECESINPNSSALALPASVTTLRMTDCNLQSINGLGKATQLTHLELGQNQISDLSPLSSLTNLTYLHLRDNDICDITPLETLAQLKTLDLENNLVTDLSPVKTLTALENLNISWNQISDLSVLNSLPKLQSVMSEGNPVAAVTFSDTHPLYPDGAAESVRLANVSVEKIWDGLYAAGSKEDDDALYAVAMCRVNEVFYENNTSENGSTHQKITPRSEGDICYLWMRLSDTEAGAAAAYDRFRDMLNQTDAIIVYGHGDPLHFDLNTPQGRAVGNHFASQLYGKETLSFPWVIRAETVDSWGIIPISDGKTTAGLMKEFINTGYSMPGDLDQTYSGKYFMDGDDAEKLHDGLWRYVEDVTGNQRPAEYTPIKQLDVAFTVEKFRNEPFPVFDRQHTVVYTDTLDDFTYTIYQVKGDKQYYLYITVGGVDYDLGIVSADSWHDMDRFKTSRLHTTKISSQMSVYKLVRSMYMLSTTTYFTIQDHVPVLLYSIEMATTPGEEYNLDLDENAETISNHGGTTSANFWIFDWDINSGEVRIADLREQLDCIQFEYDPETGCLLAVTNDRSPLGRWVWTDHPYLYREGKLIYVGEEAVQPF